MKSDRADLDLELITAIQDFQHDVLEKHLKAGLMPNYVLMHGYTLLMIAVQHENIVACDPLKKFNVDFRQEVSLRFEGPGPIQALHIAIGSKKSEALTYLLENGINPDIVFIKAMRTSSDRIRLVLLRHMKEQDIDALFFKENNLTINIPDSSELVLNLLLRPSFLRAVYPTTFLAMIVVSDEIAEFVANNAEYAAKFNSIDNKGQQVFLASCTAHVIMATLIDRKLLPESARTNLTELNIYRKIWSSPGNEADPDKIIAYLQALGIEIDCLDFKNISNQLLELTSKIKTKGLDLHTSALERYGYFKFAAKSRYKEIPTHHKLPDNLMTEHSILLLVELVTSLKTIKRRVKNALHNDEKADLKTHIVFGQHKLGMFSVFDPGSAKTKTYQSLEEYVDKQNKFTGLSFNIK